MVIPLDLVCTTCFGQDGFIRVIGPPLGGVTLARNGVWVAVGQAVELGAAMDGIPFN